LEESYALLTTPALLDILHTRRRNLHDLELAAAQHGIYPVVAINNGIWHEQDAIVQILDELKRRSADIIAVAELKAHTPYAYISYIKGDQTVFSYGLMFNHTTIGRANCTITLPQECCMVSNVHCAITRKGRVTMLQDLQSKHGTFVNGLQIHSMENLTTGDKIMLAAKTPHDQGAVLLYHQHAVVVPTQ
jgi:hypothetical protein